VKRVREADLNAWASQPDRRPLVVRGARQVGKSHLVRTWGAMRFGKIVELNLERDPAIARCFLDNDPRATLARLEAIARARIPADGAALLFLDEIQAAPEVLAKLRWFAEELPALPLVCAGSLLDFALRDPRFSMPVGRVTFMHLEPMGFGEFMQAMGEERLAGLAAGLSLDEVRAGTAALAPLHDRVLDLFRQYLLVGGMPAAVERYRRDRSLLSASEIHGDLLAALRSDFAKYAERVHQGRLNKVLSSVAQQVGGKFRYAQVDRAERSAVLAKAVELLCMARVCHRVGSTPASAIPLGAGVDEKRFKLILLDVGLLSASLGLSVSGLEPGADLMLANRGALAEQVVGQLLRLCFRAHEEPALYYWHRESPGSEAEIDYVTQQGARVVPVEVKAGATGSLKSLHLFMAERRLPLAVRFNADAPSITDVEASTRLGTTARYTLLSLPLYLAEELPRLALEAAPRQRR
jgi:uncharacterized protein